MRKHLNFQINDDDEKFDPVSIARPLRPLLLEHAEQAEKEGRIVEPVFEALRDSGLFRMTAPRRAGGFCCSIITHMRTVAELGKSCAGTAWAFGLLSGVTGTAAGMHPIATQYMFKTGEELFCSVSSYNATATPTDGGYLVSGEWGYGSGCLHADWAMNGVKILDDAGQVIDQGFASIPLHDKNTTIKNTWHVLGVMASGSNTIVADNVFIPDFLVLPDSAAPSRLELLAMPGLEPRDLRPLEPVFPLGVLSPTLGAAEALLETISAAMQKKTIVGWEYQSQIDSQLYIQQIGEAAMEIDSAWLHVERAAKLLDEKAPIEELSGYDKAQAQSDCGYAMLQIRRAADRLMDIAGPSGFAIGNPLQRYWRDLSFASRHSALHSKLSLELYGRARLEQPSNLTLLPDISA